MNKKFITVSISIFLFSLIFILGFKFILGDKLLYTDSTEEGVFIYKLFNFTNYDLKSFTVSIFLILISIIGLVVFLVSNYISLRIYKNKDLA